MTASLYLDTARLGRMSPAAQAAQRDLAALAGEVGGSQAFDDFFREGVRSHALAQQSRFAGLLDWRGIDELRAALRALAQSPPQAPILIANRSAQLMNLGARLLFYRCQNVLVTDLGWPAYQAILDVECRRLGRRITSAAVREDILGQRLGEEGLLDRLRDEYTRHQCDGLFLTAVSSLGVALPVERIVRTLDEAREIRFVVVDGAQEFCHVGSDLRPEYCDLYLTGTHKWLGAFMPLGLAFCGKRRTRDFVETVVATLANNGDLGDPLLQWTAPYARQDRACVEETVNVASLFTCQAAVSEALAKGQVHDADIYGRRRNLATVAALTPEIGWLPVQPDESFRSGILLLQAERAATRLADPVLLRQELCRAGVALTTYAGGWLRLSLPEEDLQTSQLDLLAAALKQVA